MKLKYDFDSILPKKDKVAEDPTIRRNLRIAKCCGNCRFFWYRQRHERRGYCKLPNPKNKNRNISEQEAADTWPRSHITSLCDRHNWRSKEYSIKFIRSWVGKEIPYEK